MKILVSVREFQIITDFYFFFLSAGFVSPCVFSTSPHSSQGSFTRSWAGGGENFSTERKETDTRVPPVSSSKFRHQTFHEGLFFTLEENCTMSAARESKNFNQIFFLCDQSMEAVFMHPCISCFQPALEVL